MKDHISTKMYFIVCRLKDISVLGSYMGRGGRKKVTNGVTKGKKGLKMPFLR